MFDATTFQLQWALLKVKHPTVKVSALFPLATAMLEAGPGFNSNRAVRDNNLFGMKYPEGRANAGLTTATGRTADGFAVFPSKLAAVEDMMMWCVAHNLLTNEDYVKHIKAGKYDPGNPAYYGRWQPIVEKLRPTILDPLMLVAKPVLALAGVGLAITVGVKLLKNK